MAGPATLEAPAERARALDAETVFSLLDDEDTRAILGALHEPRTARELMTACDIPRSTTYRKLDDLVDAGLVAQRIRPSRSGNHASEYARTIDGVHVDLSSDGVRVDAERTPR
jgi:predicted transcriptional regulator